MSIRFSIQISGWKEICRALWISAIAHIATKEGHFWESNFDNVISNLGCVNVKPSFIIDIYHYTFWLKKCYTICWFLATFEDICDENVKMAFFNTKVFKSKWFVWFFCHSNQWWHKKETFIIKINDLSQFKDQSKV